MTVTQYIITIALCSLATILTRSLPFILFRENKETPEFIKYIGKFLPSAVFGMLVVYCLKDIKITVSPFGIPELVCILVTAALHLWKKQMILSILGGTLLYILISYLL